MCVEILFRAVDEQGNTVDYLLTEKRDTKTAARFLNKSISRNRQPSMISIDKSAANKAGINRFYQENHRRVIIRQCKY